MFLTQEHSSTFIAVDGNLAGDIDSEDILRESSVVFQEIENVLQEYPEHPYQTAFSIDELRRKLVNHVLSLLPKRNLDVGGSLNPTAEDKSPYRLKQERIHLNVLIRGSIMHILRENADWVSRHLQLQRSNSSVKNT
jgi:hypothetical protein